MAIRISNANCYITGDRIAYIARSNVSGVFLRPNDIGLNLCSP